MSQSLVKNLLHLVWSTKNRQQFISEGIRGDLEKYIGGIFRNLNTTPIQIGAAPDHIHCLVDLTKNTALKEVLEKVKSSSSKWMKELGTKYQNFYWQNGYAGFSISASHKDAVIEYIRGQWEHHRRYSFQEELLRLLEKYNLPYDERYLWD